MSPGCPHRGLPFAVFLLNSCREEGVLSLQGDNEELLEENMCFHLIPFVMLDEGTIGISETVRVTPEGAVSFFNFPREVRLIKPE